MACWSTVQATSGLPHSLLDLWHVSIYGEDLQRHESPLVYLFVPNHRASAGFKIISPWCLTLCRLFVIEGLTF